MCSTCPEAIRAGPWFTRDGSPITCGITGQPVEVYIQSCAPSCPIGRHPGADGVIVAHGLRWLGVPMPDRLFLWRLLTGPMPGCGCILVLKVAWERFKARLRAMRCRRSCRGACRGTARTPPTKPGL